ncbi:MAG TPA: alpha/beta hydrolase [Solirubrobacterales bacterium]|jgi:pimeloyl-ACP methyl ester carboxylesterase|nr:alpha/beta hydrolase [Solirubrobacterales bacterium]
MAVGALVAGPPDAAAVVLIHGLAGTRHSWDRVLPLIEPHARVYVLDLAGGESIEQEADAAAALIPDPAILVGHSRGGLVATAIAERHPDRAEKLILLCPPWATESRRGVESPVERALAVPGIGDLLWALATEKQQREGLASAFAPGARVPDRSVDDLRATGRRDLVASSRGIDAYLAAAPLAERLLACGAPAELVFGDRDGRVTLPPSRALEHTLVPGLGHMPPLEDPERIAELITVSLPESALKHSA